MSALYFGFGRNQRDEIKTIHINPRRIFLAEDQIIFRGFFVLYRYGYSGYKLVIVRYCHLVMGMVFDLIPIVIAWGTIALVIATYTPVFNWISYPMGLYMKLFLIFMERTLIAIPLIVLFANLFL